MITCHRVVFMTFNGFKYSKPRSASTGRNKKLQWWFPASRKIFRDETTTDFRVFGEPKSFGRFHDSYQIAWGVLTSL